MTHYKERLDQRINSLDSLPVSYETSTANYVEVGTFKITDLIKNQINTVVNNIENTKFRTNIDYAVKVTQFPLNSATVKFNSEESKREAQGKQLVASVIDSKGESNGNEVYAIVRGGNLTTFCFVKSYTGAQNGLQGKLRVDAIIKNLKNLR